MTILSEIQKKIFLTSNRKTLNALEGAYKATMHSRSLDFDDLKEYTPGDNAKDISWKATAKSPKILVKRFIADKQFPVTFIIDTGKNMQALSGTYNPKFEILEAIITVLGKTVIKHNDSLGSIIGDAKQTKRLPFKSTLTHLETILHTVRKQFTSSAHIYDSEPTVQLETLMKLKINRSIVIVVSDAPDTNEELSKLLNRVQQRHDVLWVSVGDLDPFTASLSSKVVDVSTGVEIPAYIRNKKNLHQFYVHDQTNHKNEVVSFFHRHKVSYVEINSIEDVVPALTDMLMRRKHEK